jgi:hypothetical protein
MGLYTVDWFASAYVTGFLFFLAYYFVIRLVVSVGQNLEVIQFSVFVPRIVSDDGKLYHCSKLRLKFSALCRTIAKRSIV